MLLDEMLPKRLIRLFDKDTEATTVAQQGWKGTKDGRLLALAEQEFEVFVTMDRGIEHQQDIAGLDLVIVRLEAPSNSYPDLSQLMGELNSTVSEISRSGSAGTDYPEVLRVGFPSR